MYKPKRSIAHSVSQLDPRFHATRIFLHTKCYFQLTGFANKKIMINKTVAVDKSSFIFCTQFGVQSAGNRISELPDFKIFWGSIPPKKLYKLAEIQHTLACVSVHVLVLQWISRRLT